MYLQEGFFLKKKKKKIGHVTVAQRSHGSQEHGLDCWSSNGHMTVGAFNFFKKNNILYLYIYITNLIIKHKRNVAQLVRALKFKHERRGSNPPLSLPFHFGLFKKARGPARPPARQPAGSQAGPRAQHFRMAPPIDQSTGPQARPELGRGPPIYGPARPARWRPLTSTNPTSNQHI